MEIVIPPRDRVNPSYRYTYDENGEVTQVQRVAADQPAARNSATERARRGRQTVQWPFQSVVTETTEISSPTNTTPPFARRATWQPPKRPADNNRDSYTDSIRRDIVPDYVINYIRGETPETVARRKRNGGKLGERGVDVAHQHQPHESHAAEFEGFSDAGGGSSQESGTVSSEQGFLPGSREKGKRNWRRLTLGWRAGVALNALMAFLIFVVTAAALISAIAVVGVSTGRTAFFTGACATAGSINWGLHAAINVLVMVLLAGANYCFQVLSSPTRGEVDAAHEKKKWLDIGIPSVRNFAYIKSSRVGLAVLILVAAIFTQVIYNAVIFTTQSAADHEVVFVAQTFLTGTSFSNDSSSNAGGLTRLEILSLQNLADQHTLTNLTSSACLQEFSGAFEIDFDAVLLVTDSTSQANSLVQTAPSGTSLSQYVSTDGTMKINGFTVKYCLAKPSSTGQTCTVSLNGPLLGATVVLNLISVFAILVVALGLRFDPLVTLGDALTSFLRDPDPITRGACLMSKTDVWQGRWGLREAKYWVPKEHYWLKSPSVPRWALVIFLWAAMAGLATASLALSMIHAGSNTLTGFGAASPRAVVALPAAIAASYPAAALITNLPQLLLAALYLSVNALLTTYFLSHESSLFALSSTHSHRPLRVSAAPEGHQTTSLFLTLPRPWSWLLLALFAATGFVLSQSVFVVAVTLVDPSTSTTTTTGTITALGFSGAGLLVLLALLVVLGALVIGLGLRRAPPAVLVNGESVGNPMALPAGSCSAVISARCHRVPGETDLWTRPLVWGVVHEGMGMQVSHCTFTAGGAAQLDVGRNYA